MIKRLAKCVREYKKDAILTPVFVIGEVVMEVIIPLLMASLIDNGINAGSMDFVLKMGVILLVCAIISMFFGGIAGRTCAVASAGFAKNLRHDMFYNIQNYAFSNIDKFSTASLVTRLTTDVNNVQQSFMMIIRMAVRSPMMFFFSFIFAFGINAKLASIFLCVVPFLLLGMFLIIRKAHPLFKRVFKTYDKLNSIVEENVRGIRVVKSFNRQNFEINKFQDISGSIYNDFVKAEKTIAFNAPLMQMSVYICTILISWFGAKLVVNSGGTELSTGELMSLFTYTAQLLNSLMFVSMIFVMMTMSKASAERIVEVLDEKSDIAEKENAETLVKDGSIIFDNVDFSYSKNADKLCLDNINISISSGETIGIIGGTGSSKSTLVQLIPRLYDVKNGCVKVGGKDVREYSIEALRNEVAMVLQKNVLFSGTIKDNLRWGKEDATDEEIIKACSLACADEFIEKFPDKYDTYIEQGGANVSGGQKQRLCIARALLKKPKILILDDSTSAVDTATDAKIRKAFREEIPETTKIIIAQRISSVLDADRIIVLDDGKISAVGNHNYLLETSCIYKEVYESQMKGGDDNG
ncbi:MAG: ABC transporter ATP-binding protein [Clostridia bacterium]|nr:ABC transporter ATP-binding protein [Clostridia bacterium]